MTKRTTSTSNARAIKLLKVAIVSDIHAVADGRERGASPSHCCVTETDPNRNPLLGLRKFIRDQKLKADLLLCPGDIGDKAHPTATHHAWQLIHEIKSELGAHCFAAVTGNHDIDSRHSYNKYDAKGMLQTLDPPYPFSDRALNDRYWARHFVVICSKNYRVVVVNSSAFHGEGRYEDTGQYEFERGRISDHTLAALRTELESKPAPLVNILLCHHHPHPHSELGLGEGDLMLGGRELLEMLDGTFGSWLVIHGHKHHPKIEYAAGGTSSAVVFAAGSLAAVLHGDLHTASRNQFYILEFPYGQFKKLGFVGRFRAWDWLSGHGWRAASKGSQLPPEGGFGWRGDMSNLATKVKRHVRKDARWTEITSKLPELQYVLPKDGRGLVRRLANELGLSIEPPDEFPPTLLGRP